MTCSTCLTAKATLTCGICESQICKACALFLDEDSFSYLSEIPENLNKDVYCNACFQKEVSDALFAYNENVEKAKNVFVYLKEQGKETRLMKRSHPLLRVTNCKDKEEALLRLAFQAVTVDCNAIIDVSLKAEKVRSHAYQTLRWHATAIPTTVEKNRFNR